jgi:hypothetical protein
MRSSWNQSLLIAEAIFWHQQDEDKIMQRMLIVLGAIMVLSNPVWAKNNDIQATYTNKEGEQIIISARDDRHIRLDHMDGSYMLLTGDKTYSVRNDNGQWKAFDLDEMVEMAKRFGGGSNPEAKMDTYKFKIKKLGRTEKHAGYKGKVYLMETRDETGKLVSKEEAVFSTHKDIKRIHGAWLTMMSKIGSNVGFDFAKAMDSNALGSQQGKYGGLLRYGDETKLTKVTQTSLKASHYELPKGTQMEKMEPPGAMTPPSVQKPPASAEVEPEDDETPPDSLDEVKKGIGGMLKNIFN